jgi:hypothetical protein
MLSLETIRFANEHEALLAHVRQDTPADAIIAALAASADLPEWRTRQAQRNVEDEVASIAGR